MQAWSRSQGKIVDVPDTQSGAVSSGDVNSTSEDTTGGLSGDQFKQAALLDLLKTGGKNISNLKAAQDIISPAPTAAQASDIKKNKDVASAAKNYLDTYQSLLSKGDTISADAQRQLAFAAGKYNSIAGFGEGGKQLTGTELGVLAPTLIKTERQREQNFIEKMFGTQPALTKGLLQEDPATAAEKMKLALKNTDPALYAKYQNIGGGQTQQGPSSQGNQGTQETLNPNIAQNVGRNITDILGGLPALGKSVLDMSPAGQLVDLLQGKQIDPAKPFNTALKMGAGIVNNLGETVGVVKDGQGNLTWSPKAAFIHDYNHPVDTALWILPFVKGLKGMGGANGAESGILDTAAKEATSANLINKASKAGEAARGVATVVPESVLKSEEIMGKALQYTKSNNIVGMAKELETSIPEQGKVIDSWAKAQDAKIGPQPLGEVVDQVMNEVKNTTAAKANPNLISIVQKDLEKNLRTGELEGGMAKGQPDATNFSAMNDARKYFTSGKDSWFNKGQPVGSPTNDLNAMEWSAANGLKKIISEADTQGVVKSALDKQHTAYQTSPVLSKIASRKGAGLSSISMKWGLIRKAWEATGAKVAESAKISRARSLQDVLQPQGEAPVPSPVQNNPQSMPTRQYPAPNEAIKGILKGGGNLSPEEQLNSLKMTLGNPTFRGFHDFWSRMVSGR